MFRLLFLLILFSSSINAVTVTVSDFPAEGVGEPGQFLMLNYDVENLGQGGAVVYYSVDDASKVLAYSGCISPSTSVRLNLPVPVVRGEKNYKITLEIFDYWSLLSGDSCASTTTSDYASNKAKAYSTKTIERNILVKGGCNYNAPVCDSSHNCQNNECVLKPGCQYNNPACGSSYDCISNQCVLKKGCQYNNPACTYGFSCIDNSCVEIITAEDEAVIKKKIEIIFNKSSALASKLSRLDVLLREIEDESSLDYWKNIKNSLLITDTLITEINKETKTGVRKHPVRTNIANYVNTFETEIMSELGETPKTMLLPTATPVAPIVQTTTVAPISTTPALSTRIDAARIKALLERIPEFNSLDPGAKMDMMLLEKLGVSFFEITKTNSEISVYERDVDGDISFSIDERYFLEIEASQNPCSEFYTKTEQNLVSASSNVDELTLIKYCKLKPCLSPITIPAIDGCLN